MSGGSSDASRARESLVGLAAPDAPGPVSPRAPGGRAHLSAVRNLSAPTTRQNTDSGGMRIDVTTISAMWPGDFEGPRSREAQKRAVSSAHKASHHGEATLATSDATTR